MLLYKKPIRFFISSNLCFLLICFISLPLLSGHSREQISAPKIKNKPHFEKQIQFEHITVDQGLCQNSVFGVLQDQEGFLWFITQGGLNKYDGFNLEVYKNLPFDSTSISDSEIMSLNESYSQPDFFWVGTRNGGLNRLDKKTGQFKHYKHILGDSTSLSHNWVFFTYEDSVGHLWVMTRDGGIDRLNPETGKFTRFRPDPDNPFSLSHKTITVIFEDSNGILWLGTPTGLNKFDRKTESFIRYTHDPENSNSLSHNCITSIIESAKEPGILWVGTGDSRTLEGGGLNRFDTKTSDFKHYTHDIHDPESISSNFILQILEGQKGDLWIASVGLNKFNYQTGQFIKYFIDPSDPASETNIIRNLFEDSRGNLWIQTKLYDDGIYLFDTKKSTFTQIKHDVNNPQSLSVNEVTTIFEDRSGVLWFGTIYGGINKLDLSRQQFANYETNPNIPNSLSNSIVRAVYQNQDSILWVGVLNKGLNKINRITGKITYFVKEPGNQNSLGDDDVWAIYGDHSDILWLATQGGGLDRFDPVRESFTHFRHDDKDPNSLSDNRVWTIYESPREPGVLWIGTEYGGINRFDTDKMTFKHFHHDPHNPHSLSHNFVKAIYEDLHGNLWFGTHGGGLNKFDRENETFTVYQHDPQNTNSLSINYILSLYCDTSGIIWIATMGGGLNRFDPETEIFTCFTKENSEISDNIVYGILPDEKGNLWISSNRGICKFNPQDNSFFTYTVDDGLQSNEFNGGAYFKSPSGEMFFGGINGLNSFYPSQIQINQIQPQIAFTRFTLFNEDVPIGPDCPLKFNINQVNEIRLKHWQNDISLEYAALHFSIPEKNQYAYKLENYDKKWRYVGNERTATFTNLDPGKYIFRVKASNSDGIWNEEGASVRIIITPPFWKTLWFRILIGVMFIALINGCIIWRTRKIQQKKKALEIQVKEKTEAAQALQNALSEVERLKSRLQAENVYLQNEINLEHNFDNIITNSSSFKKVLQQLEQVATTDSTVLIIGETGTGKELLARAIHSLSKRKNSPLIKVDCASLPPTLIESELFGHEKGAFTGATAKKPGRFEIAHKGTIFLDEIGEMPPELQTKLLRVLQEGEIQRIGSNKVIKVDVRVIAATNRNLEEETKKGTFREDLFFRLNVFPIHIPPLRERKDDIPILVKYFVKKYNTKLGSKVENIPQSVIDTLQKYHWPGNVRELENIIQRAIILSTNSKLVLGDWVQKGTNGINHSSLKTLEEMEKSHILKALKLTGGKVSGKKGAAKILEVNPKTLHSRMKKLGIKGK